MADRRNSLAEVERKLEEMKIDNGWSMKKLTDEVRLRGISLRNGVEYGSEEKLRGMMAKNKSMVVSKHQAKKYCHAKKCLIKMHP